MEVSNTITKGTKFIINPEAKRNCVKTRAHGSSWYFSPKNFKSDTLTVVRESGESSIEFEKEGNAFYRGQRYTTCEVSIKDIIVID